MVRVVVWGGGQFDRGIKHEPKKKKLPGEKVALLPTEKVCLFICSFLSACLFCFLLLPSIIALVVGL